MLRLIDYDERVDFLLYPDGRPVLLPNDWDLAAERARIADLENRRKDIESDKLPPPLQEYAEIIEKYEGESEEEKPGKPDYDRAVARVKEWEDRRVMSWEFLNNSIRASERLLDKLEAGPHADDDVVAEGFEKKHEIFVLKTFSHSIRTQVDDEHLTIDPETHAKELDVNARNIALLRLAVVGVRDEKGKMQPLEGYPDVVLPDAVVRTLIGRMWARNSMDDQLVGYFRAGRKAARG